MSKALSGRTGIVAFAMLAMLSWSVPAVTSSEEPFLMQGASARLHDGVHVLDAVSRLQLTPRVAEALQAGVAIHIAYEIEIRRHRNWWFDADLGEITQEFRLDFHELTRQYVVTNINTGQQRSFRTVRSALHHIGRLLGFPLVDAVLVEDPERYYGRVRVRLQRERLPLPLRPAALIYGDWNLRSEWQTWSFEP